MGLRFKEIVPSPSSLENPIPLRDEAPQELPDLQGLPDQVTQTAEPLEAPQEEPEQPDISRSPAGEGISDEELIQLLEENPDIDPDELGALLQGDQEEDPVRSNISGSVSNFFRDLKERGTVSLGRKPEEQAKILKKLLGKGGKVKIKDGELLFKRKGEAKFQQFDPGEFGLSELGLDIADFGGDLTEAVIGGLASLGFTMGGAAAGGAVGGAVGSFPGSLTGAGLGGTGAAIASRPAAIAIGKTGRSLLAQLAGSEGETLPDATEVLLETGIDFGMAGMGRLLSGVRPAISKVRLAAEKAIQASKEGRLEQLSLGRKEFLEALAEMGKGTKRESALNIVDGEVNKIFDNLTSTVRIFRDEAQDEAKRQGKKFSPKALLKELDDILADNGVSFDKSGMATDLPKGLRSLAPFKDTKSGKSTLEALRKVQNQLVLESKAGGTDLDVIENVIGGFQNLIDFKKAGDIQKPTGEAVKVFKRLRNAARQDETLAITETLGDKLINNKSVTEAFEQASNKLDDVKIMKKIFDPDKGIKFDRHMFNPDNIKDLRRFKNLFGTESKQWEALKGSYILDIMDDAIQEPNFFVNEKAIFKRLSDSRSGSGDIAREFFTEGEINNVKNILRKTANITKRSDIFNPNEPEKIFGPIMGLAAPLLGVRVLPGTKLRSIKDLSAIMFKKFKGNADLLDAFTEESILEFAEKATTRQERINILQLRSSLLNVINSAKRVETAKGKAKYVITNATKSLIEQQPTQEAKKAISGIQEELNDL